MVYRRCDQVLQPRHIPPAPSEIRLGRHEADQGDPPGEGHSRAQQRRFSLSPDRAAAYATSPHQDPQKPASRFTLHFQAQVEASLGIPIAHRPACRSLGAQAKGGHHTASTTLDHQEQKS